MRVNTALDDVAGNVCSPLMSGYVSAELTTRRRRQVIAYLLVPYVVLQAGAYPRPLFCST
jgi:hypothetical protein